MNFPMQVGTGGPAGAAQLGNDPPRMHPVAFLHQIAGIYKGSSGRDHADDHRITVNPASSRKPPCLQAARMAPLPQYPARVNSCLGPKRSNPPSSREAGNFTRRAAVTILVETAVSWGEPIMRCCRLEVVPACSGDWRHEAFTSMSRPAMPRGCPWASHTVFPVPPEAVASVPPESPGAN